MHLNLLLGSVLKNGKQTVQTILHVVLKLKALKLMVLAYQMIGALLPAQWNHMVMKKLK